MITETTTLFHPLSAAGEERVDQRSVVGVSQHARQAITLMSLGDRLTRSSLCSTTLSAASGKEGKSFITLLI